MIDSEIIIYKDKLKRTRTRPATDKAFDSIHHLEWLRNVLSSTYRSGGLKICCSFKFETTWL